MCAQWMGLCVSRLDGRLVWQSIWLSGRWIIFFLCIPGQSEFGGSGVDVFGRPFTSGSHPVASGGASPVPHLGAVQFPVPSGQALPGRVVYAGGGVQPGPPPLSPPPMIGAASQLRRPVPSVPAAAHSRLAGTDGSGRPARSRSPRHGHSHGLSHRECSYRGHGHHGRRPRSCVRVTRPGGSRQTSHRHEVRGVEPPAARPVFRGEPIGEPSHLGPSTPAVTRERQSRPVQPQPARAPQVTSCTVWLTGRSGGGGES